MTRYTWHQNLPHARRERRRQRISIAMAVAIILSCTGLGTWAIVSVPRPMEEIHCDHPTWEDVDYAVVAATCQTTDGSPVRVHLID